MTRDTRDLRELYERATEYGEPAFIDRPYYGSPAAPAMDETNASNVWAHLNAGVLTAYEHSRWWKESLALRNHAVIGDWSWLGKVSVTGPDAAEFMEYATVADVSGQDVGEARFTPMVNEAGKIAIEGATFKLDEDEYLFTQSAAKQWFDHLDDVTDFDVEIEDVTPEYTVYALQGPRSLDVLEAVTGETFSDLEFSTFRRTEILETEVIVDRLGVTGELGYEFLMPTDSGRAHELWRTIREVGADYGLRELGFRAQMIGHTEIGVATAIRDYIPARLPAEAVPNLARHWMSHEEVVAIDWDYDEHFCSPRALGWAPIVDLDHEFYGREAMIEEANAGGPARQWVGLRWNSDDVADLFATQFQDAPAAPPPNMAYGQFRMQFLRVRSDGDTVGWATGQTYSPNVRRMLSNARVEREHADPGTEVAIEWGGFSDEPTTELRAEVVHHPFVERHDHDDVSGR